MNLTKIRSRIRAQNIRIAMFAAILGIVLLLNWLSNRYSAPQIALNVLQTIAFGAVMFFIASVIVRLTTKPVQTLASDAELEARLILSKLYSSAVYLTAFVIILVRLGVNAGNITIFLGFVATGFAFSIRDVITAYLAWFILLTKKPFRIGETIEIDGLIGRVQHIGTFYVILDPTPDTRSDYLRVPNILFLQKPIRNYGLERIPGVFEVHIKKIPATFAKRKASVESELADLGAIVSVNASERSLTVLCEYTYTLSDRYAARHRVAEAIARTFTVTQV